MCREGRWAQRKCLSRGVCTDGCEVPCGVKDMLQVGTLTRILYFTLASNLAHLRDIGQYFLMRIK